LRRDVTSKRCLREPRTWLDRLGAIRDCAGVTANFATIPPSRRIRIDAASQTKGHPMNIHLGLTPVISILAGILILVMPKLLNYIVAFYLIAIGLIGILGVHQLHLG
jgi:hypothetical protein